MGRLFMISLEGKFYSCKHCQTHLALSLDVVSKCKSSQWSENSFTGHLLLIMSYIENHSIWIFHPSLQYLIEIVVHSPYERLFLDTRFHFGESGLPQDQSFHCRHGKAYLFQKVVNVTAGTKEERMMLTGLHTVSDVFCVGCSSNLGWKYISAHEKTQKYKEGKFVLERFKLTGPDANRYWVAHDTRMGSSDADDA